MIRNVLMTISGKAGNLYRHDLAQLYSKKNATVGLSSTVDSMINKIPEKLMPKKFFTASARVPDTKGIFKCSVGHNPNNGYRYLCGITPTSILLMQFYSPLNKFLLLKTFDHYFPAGRPLNILEMIVLPDMEYPILCHDVRTSGSPEQVDLCLINLNIHSGGVWLDKDKTLDNVSHSHHLSFDELDMNAFGDGTETVVPARFTKNSINPVSVKCLDPDTLLIAYDSKFQLPFFDSSF